MASTEQPKQAQPEAWKDLVRISPGKQLEMRKDKPVRVNLSNDSNHKLAFKIKTTRFDDVKPTIGVGVLAPNGGKTDFRVAFKSIKDARPFSDQDRITILMHELPAG